MTVWLPGTLVKKKESNKENIEGKREKLVTLIMNKLILNDNNPIRDCQSGFFFNK